MSLENIEVLVLIICLLVKNFVMKCEKWDDRKVHYDWQLVKNVVESWT